MSDVIRFPPRDLPGRSLTVPRSIKYRRRASQLGQQADAEPSEEKMLVLMHQALSWIQLAENEELLSQNEQSPVVLVVEDTPLQRLHAVSMIEHARFEALEAASAEDALSILETHSSINVVFTDMRMPGSMDGLKLAAAIKTRWPSMTVLTTSGVLEIRDEQLPAGCLFLSKPYSAEQLVGAIQRAIAAA